MKRKANGADRVPPSERAKANLFAELRAYAERNGGKPIDLDLQLEAAGIESMFQNVPR